MTRPSKSARIGLLSAAFALNAVILFIGIPQISARLHDSYNQDSYADGYDLLAANLASGHAYRTYPDTARTLSREPGYPVLLAGIFVVFGNNFAVVKLANLLFAFGAAWIMTRIAGRLSANPIMILGPPLLFLFHPGTLIAESRGGIEILFTFLLLLFILTLYRAMESNSVWDFAVCGAALGLTVLVRSTPILFPVLLLAYLIVFHSVAGKFSSVRNVAVMIAMMFVMLSPWIIRNYSLTGKFIPTASVLGISAHAGLYDNTHLSADQNWGAADRAGAEERRQIAVQLGYPFKRVDGAYYQDFYSTADELKFSSYLSKLVLGQYEKSPMLFVRCLSANLFNLWFRGKTATSTLMNIVLQTPYLILAIAGVLLAVKNNQFKSIAPMLLLLFYIIAVYVTILAQARYSVPLMPILSIFGGFALVAVQRRFAGQRDQRASVAFAGDMRMEKP